MTFSVYDDGTMTVVNLSAWKPIDADILKAVPPHQVILVLQVEATGPKISVIHEIQAGNACIIKRDELCLEDRSQEIQDWRSRSTQGTQEMVEALYAGREVVTAEFNNCGLVVMRRFKVDIPMYDAMPEEEQRAAVQDSDPMQLTLGVLDVQFNLFVNGLRQMPPEDQTTYPTSDRYIGIRYCG